MATKNHSVGKYITAFLLTCIICIALLLVTALLPQSAIAEHISASLPGLEAEGTYPRLSADDPGTMLDNYTDSLILMEVLGTNSSDIGTVFSNPLFLYKDDPLESLVYLNDNPDLQPDGYYVRYWMGFRVTLRLLFSLFTYSQIRKITFVVFFLLLGIAACSVARHTNIFAAIGLIFSFILVHPMIIARSFQFSSCFLIAFSALIGLPYIYRQRKYIGVYFMIIGMLTQYFDFYTVPALTFCLPCIYLVALYAADENSDLHPSGILTLFLKWLAGYLLFWLMKLLLASVFSPIDGFSNGISELFYWVNRNVDSTTNKYLYAYERVFSVVFPTISAAVKVLVFLLVFPAIYYISKVKNQYYLHTNRFLYFIIILIPLVWFGAAATPTANHAFFQYRSVMAVFWGWCLLFTGSMSHQRFSLTALLPHKTGK